MRQPPRRRETLEASLSQHRSPKIPLRLFLAVPFVLLILGANGLVGYLSWRHGQQEVKHLVNRLMIGVGDRVTEKLNTFLATPHLIAASNVNAVELDQLNLQNLDTLERHLFQQIQLYPEVTAIYFANEQGELRAIGRHTDGRLNTSMTSATEPGARYIYWLDEQGKPARLLVKNQNYDPRHRPWYQLAKTLQRPAWTPIYSWVILPNLLSLTAVHPVYDREGAFQGVFCVDLLIRDFNDYLSKLDLSANGQIFLIERSGDLIATSTLEPTVIASETQFQRLPATQSQNPLTRAVSQQLWQKFGGFAEINTPQQVSLVLPNGARIFSQIQPYRDRYGLDLLMVMVLPESDFMAQINANSRTRLLLMIAAILSAIALGLWLARSIVQPIERLAQASLALAEGEWNEALRPDRPIKEVQLLYTAFNRMAERLQQSFDLVRSALEESEEKFTKVFRTCPDAIAIVTPEGRYLEVNDAFVELFCDSREQAIGHLASELGHWIDLDDRQRYVQCVQAGERVRNIEFSLRDKNGNAIAVLFSADRIELQGQEYIVGIAKDISARKQFEIELQESEERLRQIAETIDQFFFVRSAQTGQFLYVSPAYEKIFGRTCESLYQEPESWLETVHPDDRQWVLNSLIQQAEGCPIQREYRIIRADGTIGWIVAYISPVFDQTGQLLRYVGLSEDISDRKQTELELQQQKDLRETVYNESTDALFLVDPHTLKITDCNRRAVELFEAHNKDELIGIEGHTLQHRSFTAEEIEEIVAEMDRFGFWSREIEYVTRQGHFFWGNLAAKFVQIADRRIHLVRVTDMTKRKQAEDALRQSEASLQAFFRAIPDFVIHLQADGTRLSYQYSEHIKSLKPDLAIGDRIQQDLPPHLAQLRLHYIQQALKTGELQIYEYDIEIAGQTYYEEARIVASGSDSAFVVIRDITERKQAEAALRQSEATKNQILKAIPDLIIWMDADGTCIDLVDGSNVNNLFIKSEAVGGNLYQLLPFDLAQLREQAIKQALQTGNVQVYEQQITIQGKICYEEVRVVGVGEDRVLVIVRDVTDRKLAEVALRQSEERFRSAFHNAPIGMALIGLGDPPKQNRWLKVNPMLCDMLGYSEAELMSMLAFALVHPEDNPKLLRCVEQVLTNETPNVQVELRYCCNGGRIAWGLLNLSLVRDERHQPLYYVAQIQDITEQHTIDRMKDEFISIVSHELRTPLTAIQGFLGLLNTGLYDHKPEKAKRMLMQALTNSDRLVRLVNDILDLERLSSSKVQLVMEVCNAEDLMRRAVEGVQSLSDRAAIAISITPTTAQVVAAPELIIQTLTNLLSNAIKFSQPHTTVTLWAQTQADSVLFQVQDCGRGIPADKLETIFGRFQQVDVSDSRQKGGTGLGLAICQSIVQQHGGNIWVESTLGEGSRFYFTLPRSES